VPADVAERAFQGLTPDQKVIDLDFAPAGILADLRKYVGSSVSPERIAKGQQKMRSTAPCSMPSRASTACRRNTSWRSGPRDELRRLHGRLPVVRSWRRCLHDQAHRFFSNETVQALRTSSWTA